MTAFAIDFQRRRLTIASDTLGYAIGEGRARPLGFIDKIIPLTQLRAVIFSRGQYQICVQAAAYLMLSVELRSIEEAAAALPDILTRLTAAYAEEQQIENPSDMNLAEIVFAGWSDLEQRMKIWNFNNYEAYAPQEDGGRYYGFLTMPKLGAGDMPPIAGLPLNRQLVEALKAERRFFDENPDLMGGAILGGEIRSVEVTPEGISTRTLHRFQDFEETRNAAAAVADRIIRGEDAPKVADGLVAVADSRYADELDDEVMATGATAPSRAARRRIEQLARKAAKRAA